MIAKIVIKSHEARIKMFSSLTGQPHANGQHGGHVKGEVNGNGMLLDPHGQGISLTASGNFSGKPMNEMQAMAYKK